MQASTAPDIRTGCSTIRWLMQSTQLRILKKLKTLHSYILYIKEFDRKSFCQIWFCVAESFLITHLDPPESWKVGGDISYISSDNCHVIEKLSLLPSSFQRGNQFDLGWAVCFCLCPCVFMFVREIVFETDCV